MTQRTVGADDVTGEFDGVVETALDAKIDAKVAAEAALARNAENLTSGTVADARIPSGITRDAEMATAIGVETTRATNAENALQAQIDAITASDVESVNTEHGAVVVSLVENPPGSFFYVQDVTGT